MPQQSAAVAHTLPGAVHARHVPPLQPSEAAQVLPVQHGCPEAPQVLMGATQRPPWHSVAAPQMSPGQHTWPSAPQLVSARHMPLEHSAPRSQAVPLQHACPTAPHATG